MRKIQTPRFKAAEKFSPVYLRREGYSGEDSYFSGWIDSKTPKWGPVSEAKNFNENFESMTTATKSAELTAKKIEKIEGYLPIMEI